MNIKLDAKWKSLSYGPCEIEMTSGSMGWYTRKGLYGKFLLDVSLSQRHAIAGFFTAKQANLMGEIDTGSPYTIISRVLFENSGFCPPNTLPTNLGISGIVRKRNTGVSDDEYIWGWENVSLRINPYTLCESVGLPRCNLQVIVAENVADKKFLLGRDFVSNYPMLLMDGLLVMLGS